MHFTKRKLYIKKIIKFSSFCVIIFLESRLKRLVVKYFLRGMTYDVKIKTFMKHYIDLAKYQSQWET